MAKRKVVKPIVKEEPTLAVEPEPVMVAEKAPEIKIEVKVEILPAPIIPPPPPEPPPVLLSSLKAGTDFDLDGIHYRVKCIDSKTNLVRVAILEWSQTKVKMEKFTLNMSANTVIK